MKKGKELAVIILITLLPVFGCTQARGVRHNIEQTSENDLYTRGLRHFADLEFKEAYRCFGIARTLCHIRGDEEKEMVILNNMANAAFWAGELDSCIYRLRQAQAIACETKKNFDEYHFFTELYKVYYLKADMEQAMLIRQKSDSIAANTTDVRIRFEQLGKLAQEAENQRNLKLQEHYMLEQERLLKELPAEMQPPQKYMVYGALCQYYANQQNIDKAIGYNRKCIAISNETEGKEGLGYEIEALLYIRQRNREKAFEALDSMKRGLEQNQYVSPLFWMHYHRTKGHLYETLQEWREACAAYEDALNSVKGVHLSAWMDYHQVIFHLAGAYAHIGQFEQARRSYKIYMEYFKSQFGEQSIEYAQALWVMARFEELLGNMANGLDCYIRSTDIFKQKVSSQLCFVSPQERESYWQMFAPQLWEMVGYALKAGERQSLFTEKSYEALLFSKALLLESDRTMAEAVNTKCSEEEKRVYFEMLNIQNELKGLTNNYEQNKERIDKLHQRLSSLDKQLTPIVSRLGYTDFLKTTYADVRRMLGEKEALIDFADFYTEKTHQYAVYIIASRQQHPLLMGSFAEEDLAPQLEGKSLECIYKQPYSELMLSHIWQPLQDALRGKDTIYYVPSGLLHQVALESLPMKDGSLLGDHYHFVRLTSAREIARVKRQAAETNGNSAATLYGGLQYDVDTAAMAQTASHYPTNIWIAKTRGGGMRGDGSWGRLTNTRKEIDEIGKILARQHVTVRPRTGVEGTEESFFTMSGKAPKVLHIATHGFYYTPDGAKGVAYLNGYQDAMQLSGLILSGGNAEWTGKPIPKGVMGGVLTANDIATADLKGTDLVVLSACQTGQGKATPEGVYGLQRAFKKAGAQTIVMTLWNVSDRATKDFMVKFYEELADGSNHWNKRKAFERARQYIRETYKNPHYWAGFVMLD